MLPLTEGTRWAPACDVFTRGEDLVVRMELPGVEPEADVQITVEDGVLCISGERRQEAATEEVGYYRREWSYGAFERGIAIPEGVKEKDITASYVNGVLEVVVPGAAELPRARVVPIQPPKEKKAVAAGGAKA
jgi:HSP20 family protein